MCDFFRTFAPIFKTAQFKQPFFLIMIEILYIAIGVIGWIAGVALLGWIIEQIMNL